MKTKKYVEYMVEETKKILAIDSPSGYTAEVADYVMKAYQKLGYEPKLTTKGGVLVALGRQTSSVRNPSLIFSRREMA